MWLELGPRNGPHKPFEMFELVLWSGEVLTFGAELREAALIAGLPTG
jgi:hypothetical protein